MRKLRWLFYPVLLGVIVAAPWVLFHLRSTTPRTIVVLDKTVPFDTYIEHAGFFWLLDQLQIVHPSGERYDVAQDYIGATPGSRPGDPPSRTQDLRAEHVAGADLLYVIDTYVSTKTTSRPGAIAAQRSNAATRSTVDCPRRRLPSLATLARPGRP